MTVNYFLLCLYDLFLYERDNICIQSGFRAWFCDGIANLVQGEDDPEEGQTCVPDNPGQTDNQNEIMWDITIYIHWIEGLGGMLCDSCGPGIEHPLTIITPGIG